MLKTFGENGAPAWTEKGMGDTMLAYSFDLVRGLTEYNHREKIQKIFLDVNVIVIYVM